MNTIAQYDQYKCCYADILYRMGLLNQRAQILKYVSTPPEPHKGIGMSFYRPYTLKLRVYLQQL